MAPLAETKLMMLDTMAAAYELNQGRIDRNWFRVQAAFLALMFSAILSVVGLLVGLLQ